MDMMAARLAARLQRDTEDGEGWALLGRSYVVLGRDDEALAAFERARRILGDKDVQLMADYAAAKKAVSASPRTVAGNPAMPAR
jgi:cytochrome c-type biogenesis protein CcmH